MKVAATCFGLNKPSSGSYSLCLAKITFLVPVHISLYEGQLISNAHSEIFCQRSKVAMRAQCVLVATTLLHSSAKFHSFLYLLTYLLHGAGSFLSS